MTCETTHKLERKDTPIGRLYYKDEYVYDEGEFYVGVTSALDPISTYGAKDFLIDNDKPTIMSIRKKTAGAGTELHTIFEKILKGEEIQPTEKQEAAVGRMYEMIETHHLEPQYIEERVYHDVYGYAGTTDYIGNFTSCSNKRCCYYPLDGQLVGDLKTGRKYQIYSGWQIAAYREAAIHMPELDVDASCGCAGFHIPRDGSSGRPFTMKYIDACFLRFLCQMEAWKGYHYNTLKKMKWKYLNINQVELYLNSKKGA